RRHVVRRDVDAARRPGGGGRLRARASPLRGRRPRPAVPVPARESERDAALAPGRGAAARGHEQVARVTSERSMTRAVDLSVSAATTYLPIAEHGVIGDLRTVALVGTDGTIDWYCCPRFDSPSVFGSILDAERGGFYRIAPATSDWNPKQLYFPDTNVLITRFLTPGGVGEVQDFMPIQPRGALVHRHRLIRRVIGVRGSMTFRVELQPRFNYGRDSHQVFFHESGVLFRSAGLCLALETSTPMRPAGELGVTAEFTLLPGESAT